MRTTENYNQGVQRVSAESLFSGDLLYKECCKMSTVSQFEEQ
jgi:hypothetical protein